MICTGRQNGNIAVVICAVVFGFFHLLPATANMSLLGVSKGIKDTNSPNGPTSFDLETSHPDLSRLHGRGMKFDVEKLEIAALGGILEVSSTSNEVHFRKGQIDWRTSIDADGSIAYDFNGRNILQMDMSPNNSPEETMMAFAGQASFADVWIQSSDSTTKLLQTLCYADNMLKGGDSSVDKGRCDQLYVDETHVSLQSTQVRTGEVLAAATQAQQQTDLAIQSMREQLSSTAQQLKSKQEAMQARIDTAAADLHSSARNANTNGNGADSLSVQQERQEQQAAAVAAMEHHIDSTVHSLRSMVLQEVSAVNRTLEALATEATTTAGQITALQTTLRDSGAQWQTQLQLIDAQSQSALAAAAAAVEAQKHTASSAETERQTAALAARMGELNTTVSQLQSAQQQVASATEAHLVASDVQNQLQFDKISSQLESFASELQNVTVTELPQLVQSLSAAATAEATQTQWALWESSLSNLSFEFTVRESQRQHEQKQLLAVQQEKQQLLLNTTLTHLHEDIIEEFTSSRRRVESDMALLNASMQTQAVVANQSATAALSTLESDVRALVQSQTNRSDQLAEQFISISSSLDTKIENASDTMRQEVDAIVVGLRANTTAQVTSLSAQLTDIATNFSIATDNASAATAQNQALIERVIEDLNTTTSTVRTWVKHQLLDAATNTSLDIVALRDTTLADSSRIEAKFQEEIGALRREYGNYTERLEAAQNVSITELHHLIHEQWTAVDDYLASELGLIEQQASISETIMSKSMAHVNESLNQFMSSTNATMSEQEVQLRTVWQAVNTTLATTLPSALETAQLIQTERLAGLTTRTNDQVQNLTDVVMGKISNTSATCMGNIEKLATIASGNMTELNTSLLTTIQLERDDTQTQLKELVEADELMHLQLTNAAQNWQQSLSAFENNTDEKLQEVRASRRAHVAAVNNSVFGFVEQTAGRTRVDLSAVNESVVEIQRTLLTSIEGLRDEIARTSNEAANASKIEVETLKTAMVTGNEEHKALVANMNVSFLSEITNMQNDIASSVAQVKEALEANQTQTLQKLVDLDDELQQKHVAHVAKLEEIYGETVRNISNLQSTAMETFAAQKYLIADVNSTLQEAVASATQHGRDSNRELNESIVAIQATHAEHTAGMLERVVATQSSVEDLRATLLAQNESWQTKSAHIQEYSETALLQLQESVNRQQLTLQESLQQNLTLLAASNKQLFENQLNNSRDSVVDGFNSRITKMQEEWSYAAHDNFTRYEKKLEQVKSLMDTGYSEVQVQLASLHSETAAMKSASETHIKNQDTLHQSQQASIELLDERVTDQSRVLKAGIAELEKEFQSQLTATQAALASASEAASQNNERQYTAFNEKVMSELHNSNKDVQRLLAHTESQQNEQTRQAAEVKSVVDRLAAWELQQATTSVTTTALQSQSTQLREQLQNLTTSALPSILLQLNSDKLHIEQLRSQFQTTVNEHSDWKKDVTKDVRDLTASQSDLRQELKQSQATISHLESSVSTAMSAAEQNVKSAVEKQVTHLQERYMELSVQSSTSAVQLQASIDGLLSSVQQQSQEASRAQGEMQKQLQTQLDAVQNSCDQRMESMSNQLEQVQNTEVLSKDPGSNADTNTGTNTGTGAGTDTGAGGRPQQQLEAALLSLQSVRRDLTSVQEEQARQTQLLSGDGSGGGGSGGSDGGTAVIEQLQMLQQSMADQQQRMELAEQRLQRQQERIVSLEEENRRLLRETATVSSVDTLRSLLFDVQAGMISHATKVLDLLLVPRAPAEVSAAQGCSLHSSTTSTTSSSGHNNSSTRTSEAETQARSPSAQPPLPESAAAHAQEGKDMGMGGVDGKEEEEAAGG